MNVNYSKLLTKTISILGLAGVSILTCLPVQAEEIKSTEYKNQKYIAQSTLDNGILNPSPSIFREPPYNGRRRSSPVPTTPSQPIRPTPSTTEARNIVEVAKAAGSFTMLIRALEAGGLTEVLQGNGPFTVFAPTDNAFAELPQDAVRDLLKPENKEILVKILTYHVVPGKVMSSDLRPGSVKSVQGDQITVKISGNQGVFVNDGRVVRADIPASNGVIHVIDTLILPPSL
ncbi:MAG: fasciclin domain-containing protein [Sphaerospermopsis sp. SIO1G2]|nr:fasciclin domain-containing protein [Sphaerospermopsis sp. SIO1G1]NET74443.1 fasciclin domain-containing protein [Sphaerospermopsis sp. SIO1G2]